MLFTKFRYLQIARRPLGATIPDQPHSFALDREKFDLKNERGVGPDVRAWAARAIGQLRWNEKLPLRSNRHDLKGFRPPFDDLTYREGRRLAALIRTVEFLAVNQRPFVIAYDGVAGRWLGPRTFLQNLILKPARQRDDTLLRFVG